MDERQLPVLQTQGKGQAPRALVFTNAINRPLAPAEAKRARFVQNLKDNYQKLKDALAYVERFAVICELSQVRIDAIRKATDDALQDLSLNFENKLKAYDSRIRGGQ